MKDIFHIGGPAGNLLKNLATGIGARTSDDSAYANLLAKQASGSVSEHVTNWMDLRDSNALMQFAFDGATAPSPGANTGSYGMCHTSGGSYTAGQVYYDDGTELRATKIPIGTRITTGSAITGTVSMVANGIYASHSVTAPFSWTLKGDGTTGDTGMTKVLAIDIDTSATKSTTTAIPADGRVLRVITKIDSAYDNGAAIEVIVDGTSSLVIQPSTENAPGVANVYESDVENGLVTASTEGVVTVNISNTPSTGSGTVLVEFAPSILA